MGDFPRKYRKTHARNVRKERVCRLYTRFYLYRRVLSRAPSVFSRATKRIARAQLAPLTHSVFR